MKQFATLGILLLIFSFIAVREPRPLAAESASAGGGSEASSGTTFGSSGLSPATAALASELGVEFVKGSTSTVILRRGGGTKYLVDLATDSITPVRTSKKQSGEGNPPALKTFAARSDGSAVFKHNCATCHGNDGKGIPTMHTPNFTDLKVQASLTDKEIINAIMNGIKGTAMPAWAGKLPDEDVKAVTHYLRSLATANPAQQSSVGQAQKLTMRKVYEPGDDVLFTLPTGRRLDRHGFYVNFAHRFVFDPAFSGTARGGALLGLDGFAIPSFGFHYGVTDKFSVSVFRAPSLIARPIQLMAAYNLLDEHDGKPFNLAVRVSMEGLNNFQKDYTENLEGIISRSVTSRVQFYLVPTLSLNDRRLQQVFTYRSSDILDFPGHNAFSLGVGGAWDFRPTVALVAEVIPTLANGRPLGILRPAYAFGIQKKIWRHSFTLGFTTSPGTTVSQRAATRASFLGVPNADKPSGLFIGFDLTRQIY